MILRIFLLFFGMCQLCLAALDTQLSSDRTTLGESVIVTFTLDNNTRISPDFSALQKDFYILSTNYGSAVNMVNGVTSVQSFWRLQLEPKKAGDLIIPEIIFGNDKSAARRIAVTGNPVQNVSAKQSTSVFVRGEISSPSPYVQSQLLYTFKLFFRTPIRDPRIEVPQIKDAAFMQLEDRPAYQTTINGTAYNVVEKTFALFPKKPGEMTIPPVRFHTLAEEVNSNSFDDPFNFVSLKQVSTETKNFNLTIRDVPANYQGTTWLPAKDISLTEEWSNNTGHWESGTPVTRTITIQAQGLRTDQLPDLNIDKINGVNVYADRAKRSNNIKNNMIVGVLTQKITYIPNNTASFRIPVIKINWWNTTTNSNAVVNLNDIQVQVKGAASVVNLPVNKAPVAKPVSVPVLYKTFYSSVWFWIACLLFTAWIVTLWFMLRKKTHKRIKSVKPTRERTEKNFEQACHSGQALQAQQYLLAWAKSQWPDTPLNLSSLRDVIREDTFNLAVKELERVLYAKNAVEWNGEALLAAFKRVKKACGVKKNARQQEDPLPPLNPDSNIRCQA